MKEEIEKTITIYQNRLATVKSNLENNKSYLSECDIKTYSQRIYDYDNFIHYLTEILNEKP